MVPLSYFCSIIQLLVFVILCLSEGAWERGGEAGQEKETSVLLNDLSDQCCAVFPTEVILFNGASSGFPNFIVFS